MEQMGGLDAAFLYFETPSTHMHVCGVILLDPSTMPGGYSFAAVRDHIHARGSRIAGFRRTLAQVPLNLSRPYWVEYADFDIDYHVRRIAAPSPGSLRELADVVGDIASRPLDRSRPLWEMHVVEGLADGNVALVAKVHHATVDGVSGTNILFHLFDLEPDPDGPSTPADPWEPERKPSDLGLLTRGVADVVKRPFGVAKLTPSTLLRVGNILWSSRRLGGRSATPFTAPRTSFNATLTPHRKVAFTTVPLADVKTIKSAFGVKVNDVVTAIVGGALRTYLGTRDELPDKPLIAAVPVSVHGQVDASQGTSKVSFMFSDLGTEIDDPVRRLQTIAEANASAKEINSMVGASTLMEWADYAAPNTFSLAARLYSSLRFAERHPVVHNLVLSNVPGPQFPLYLRGARLTGLFPLGPIMDGAGLNVTVLSHEDRIGFGFIACRELMPGLWDLADAVEGAVAELLDAAEKLDGAATRAKPKTKAGAAAG